MPELNGSPKKIVVMGSGAIGMELAGLLRMEYPDAQIVVSNRESGKGTKAAIAWDQKESILRKTHPELNNHKGSITFTTDTKEAMRGADIVEITGGVPRTSPTQPREGLAAANVEFINPIAKAAGELHHENPNHKVNYVIGTNPIGVMDQYFQEKSKIPHDKIVGLSGELDVARLEQSIRTHLHLDYNEIKGARVVGAHDDTMVGVLSGIKVKKDDEWKPLLSLTKELDKTIDVPNAKGEIERRTLLTELMNATTKGGGKMSAWAGVSDHEAPAAALTYMTKQIVNARSGKESKPITASVFDKDAGVYSGQTIKFNADGTHAVDKNQPELNEAEKVGLQKSLENSQNGWQKFKDFLVIKEKLVKEISGNADFSFALSDYREKGGRAFIQINGSSASNIDDIKESLGKVLDVDNKNIHTEAGNSSKIYFDLDEKALKSTLPAIKILASELRTKVKDILAANKETSAEPSKPAPTNVIPSDFLGDTNKSPKNSNADLHRSVIPSYHGF